MRFSGAIRSHLQMLIESMLMLSRLNAAWRATTRRSPSSCSVSSRGWSEAFCEQHRDVLVELSLAPDLPPVEVEQTTVDQVPLQPPHQRGQVRPPGTPDPR